MNEKTLNQIQELIQKKERDMDTIKKQANSLLEIAKELKDERIERGKERDMHAGEIHEIKTAIKNLKPDLDVHLKSRSNEPENTLTQSRVTHRAPEYTNEPKKQEETNGDIILLVGDSNSNQLLSNQLHNQKQVRKLKRSTIKEAIEYIPPCEKPEKVTDIVLQLGVNDMRRGATTKDIEKLTFNLQSKYSQKFKNARFHLTALPPNEKPREEANHRLRELAQRTGSNFIGLRGMMDRYTNRLRANMIQYDGLHFTEIGVRILAKEMKRSLYSTANQVNRNEIHDLSRLQQTMASIISQGQE